jgi:putative membrane protein
MSNPTERNPTEASVATLLAQQRTALAFERTLLATDRTLMATLRTSFSMIGFGFTLFTFFRTLKRDGVLEDALPTRSPTWFGLTLVVLGILVLAHGLWMERAYRARLTKRRDEMIAAGLLLPDESMPPSTIRFAGLLLLLIALLAVLGIAARVGPFA